MLYGNCDVGTNCLFLLFNSRLTVLLASLSYVSIVGSNAGYTMFRGSVKSTGYPLYLLVPLHFPSRTSQCAVTFQVESTSCLVASLIPRPDRDCQGFASALETRRQSRGDKLPLNVNTVRVVHFAPGCGMWVYGLDWAGPG